MDLEIHRIWTAIDKLGKRVAALEKITPERPLADPLSAKYVPPDEAKKLAAPYG
jgi:hypothetical protein